MKMKVTNFDFASLSTVGCYVLLAAVVSFCSETSNSAESRRVSGERSPKSDVFTLPTRVKPCVITEELRVASRIVAKEYYEARSLYMSTIESFQVVRGQSVKKGQLLATTRTSGLEKMRSIYLDYASLYDGQLKIARNARVLAEGRKERMTGLVKKGIMSTAELEQVEREVVSAKQSEERMQRGLESMQKNVDSYSDQIKQSNFYSEISGVVTELIADPKSLAGDLNAMSGALIAKVEKPGAYRAEAQLIDTQVHGIKSGMKASISLPDGTTLDGKVTFVSTLPMSENNDPGASSSEFRQPEQQQPQSQLIYYKVAVEFERAGEILPSGLLAEVSIVKDGYNAKACLPWNAIEITDGQPYGRIFEDGKGWSRIPIKIGQRGRYDVEIITPISASAVVKSKLW